ncbi:putative extracellular solute-binding protein [Roseobacter sp. SK209-2-6]|uniref:transporter substrate-binding domain-containing protein n=1 Tax=Roseobacter sp. SK209-2-6 TaxID=388739 RepID=UPI0000F3F819|nr:transporter substrate-binding domain-containing protein [Roseobacter sp. SK209-2-6]EBA18034.1 putative extracellular solute-binding protein [Roseobacter sp. SK209-2-6]
MTCTLFKALGTAVAATVLSTVSVFAGPLEDRIAAGEPIRIGFSNIPIWGFPDEDGNAKGFVNEIALGILAEMGHTEVETTVTEWGGLIPGLKANRYDMITGGLYILNSRCQNIAFSEPIGSMGDAFLVPAGNPKNINNYKDVLSNDGSVLIMYSGANTVEASRKEGLSDGQMMQVPGPTETLAAMNAGRADAAALTYFEALYLADQSEGKFEVTDPSALPEWTKNWVGIGFRDEDAEFMAKFNAALASYVGSDAMLNAVAEYGYTPSHLPGDKTAEWVCGNR